MGGKRNGFTKFAMCVPENAEFKSGTLKSIGNMTTSSLLHHAKDPYCRVSWVQETNAPNERSRDHAILALLLL